MWPLQPGARHHPADCEREGDYRVTAAPRVGVSSVGNFPTSLARFLIYALPAEMCAYLCDVGYTPHRLADVCRANGSGGSRKTAPFPKIFSDHLETVGIGGRLVARPRFSSSVARGIVLTRVRAPSRRRAYLFWPFRRPR